jgi:hypothetical protein
MSPVSHLSVPRFYPALSGGPHKLAISAKASLTQWLVKNFPNAKADYWKQESPNTTKHLRRAEKATKAATPKLRRTCPTKPEAGKRNGWSVERRARQAALIRNWQPWKRSTGPKTDAGKARCSANAFKHGLTTKAHRDRRTAVRHACAIGREVLGMAATNLRTYRAFLRRPASGPVKLKLRRPNRPFRLPARRWAHAMEVQERVRS